MTKYARLAVAGLVVALALATAVSSASASRLSMSSQGIFASWSELEFTASTGVVARCRVTLEGSVHSATIVKTRGALIGYITRATATNCASPTTLYFALEATLPWHITYQGFTGSLPNFLTARLGISRIGFLFTFEGLNRCLYEAEPWLIELNRVAGGRIGSVTPVTTSTFILSAILSGICPTEGTFRGTGRFTALTTQLTILLI